MTEAAHPDELLWAMRFELAVARAKSAALHGELVRTLTGVQAEILAELERGRRTDAVVHACVRLLVVGGLIFFALRLSGAI